MPDIGTITSNAKRRIGGGLPFPSSPAGSPNYSSGNSYLPSPTTPAPTSVSGALSNSNATVGQAKTAIGATQPYIDQYLKPNAAGTTPFRQALYNTKASSTADAYDNAVSQARNRSAQMGFSSNSQPVTFGAEQQIANDRTKAILDIPNQVNLEAQPIEAQAAQLQQNQSGLYNALANTQNSQAGILAQQKAAADAQKAALYGGLAQTGIAVGTPILTKALGLGTKVAAPAAAGAGAAGALGGGSLAAIQAGAVPELGTLGATAVPGVTGVGAGGASAAGAGAAGGGGITGALGALATNPLTWAAAAGLVGGLIWKKSQVHPTADKWVQGEQNPFDQSMAGIDSQVQSGQLDPDQAQQLKVQNAQNYLTELQKFAQQGDHERIVARQALQTFNQWYGDPAQYGVSVNI